MWKDDDKQKKLCQLINNWHQKLQINHFLKLIVGDPILQIQEKSPAHFNLLWQLTKYRIFQKGKDNTEILIFNKESKIETKIRLCVFFRCKEANLLAVGTNFQSFKTSHQKNILAALIWKF